MSYLKRKLCSRRGDSLVEVLVAILISGLSVSLLVVMIVTSAKFNEKAKQNDADLYLELSTAESLDPAAHKVDKSIGITINGETYDIPITVFGASDKLSAYTKKVGP